MVETLKIETIYQLFRKDYRAATPQDEPGWYWGAYDIMFESLEQAQSYANGRARETLRWLPDATEPEFHTGPCSIYGEFPKYGEFWHAIASNGKKLIIGQYIVRYPVPTAERDAPDDGTGR